MKLIATKKLTYNTRHLVAGDPFEARDRDARLLIGIRKARAAEAPQRRKVPLEKNKEWIGEAPKGPITTYERPQASPSGAATMTMPDDDELTRLRKTARRLGMIVDKRWGSQTLRDKIAAAGGGSY